MLVAFSITPLGVGEGVGGYVADAVKIVRASGLPNRTDAMFTTIEGDWDEVMGVVKQAADAVAARATRVARPQGRPAPRGQQRTHRQGRLGGTPPARLSMIIDECAPVSRPASHRYGDADIGEPLVRAAMPPGRRYPAHRTRC